MGFCFCYEDDCHSIFICLMFMKKIILVCYLLSLSSLFLGQEKTTPFKAGEWLEYKMSYSGFLKAGTAKLTLEEVDLNGKKVDFIKLDEVERVKKILQNEEFEIDETSCKVDYSPQYYDLV